MKISGKETKSIDLEVKPEDVIQLTINMLSTDLGLRKDYYIKNGKIVCDEEYKGSHSWYETQIIRDATDEDRRVFEMVDHLKKLKTRMK